MPFVKEKIELALEEAELNLQNATMRMPALAKWAVGALIVLIFPAYFVAKSFAQNYWDSRLKTYQISAHPSFSDSQNAQINVVKLVKYSDGTFGAAGLVVNPNSSLASQNVQYSWTYFNAQGQTVAPLNFEATSGTTYLMPSSQRYIVVPKIQSQEVITQARLILQPITWQKPAKIINVRLQVDGISSSQALNPLVFSAEGSVTNTSPYKLQAVSLSFLVYDAAGKLLAVSQRTESDLKPYEKRSFKQLWPGLQISNANVQIFASTNTLSPDNLTLPQDQSSSSDLSHPKVENPWGW